MVKDHSRQIQTDGRSLETAARIMSVISAAYTFLLRFHIFVYHFPLLFTMNWIRGNNESWRSGLDWLSM